MARPFSTLALCVGLSLISLPATADERADVTLALLQYSGGAWNPRPNAISRLAWEVRRRTSIAIDLATPAVEATSGALFNYPFVVWLGDGAFNPLPERAVINLRHHLQSGGTLLVDLADGLVGGPFDRSVRRELERVVPDHPVVRVPSDHVVYKSYYLVRRHGGRVQSQAFLEGVFVEGRLAVVISANDMAGAMARNEFGEWTHDVRDGGDAAREAAFRLGINLVMYALCLDYKEDQVHIPFILKRRR